MNIYSYKRVFIYNIFERRRAHEVVTDIGKLNKRKKTMKKMMSIAAVALMITGFTAFAGDAAQCTAGKAECKKAAGSECSADKAGAECGKKTAAKKCSSGCDKKAGA